MTNRSKPGWGVLPLMVIAAALLAASAAAESTGRPARGAEPTFGPRAAAAVLTTQAASARTGQLAAAH